MSRTTSPALDVDSLGVRFGGLIALNNVTLSVEPGQIHGVIGPNGAGKSTLFNAISGLVPLASGSVRINGVDNTQLPPHARARCGVTRTFQSVQLVRPMTVLENILLGLHVPDSLLKRGCRDEELDRAATVAEQLGLKTHLYKTVDVLSFRDQRFVEIARALVSNPRLIMLDEPAAGLASPEVDELGDALQSMQSRHGFSILLVEHVISLVMRLCERVTVLEYGTVIASGTGKQVMADSNVIKAYLGEDFDA